jgi:hypothetical protein
MCTGALCLTGTCVCLAAHASRPHP